MKKNSKYYSILNIDLLLVMILYIPIMNFCCAFFTEGDFYGKVISILFFPVCFFLSARLIIIYNNDLRLYYLANRANYKNSLVFLFSQKTFWIKCLLFGGIYLIIPIKWTFGALADVICIKKDTSAS